MADLCALMAIVWMAPVRSGMHDSGSQMVRITTLQMRQKDPVTYKATFNGVEYKADIKFISPTVSQTV